MKRWSDEGHVHRWKALARRLTPLNRGLVGYDTDLALESLESTYSNFQILNIASSDVCHGWQVPFGWDVTKALLYDPSGEVVADFRWHPLYLFSYSPSFKGDIELEDLQKHLLSDPKRPDFVPFHFRNQYRHWNRVWGFCLPHSVRTNLRRGKYYVDIETQFIERPMKLGLKSHMGQCADSVLFLSHIDHPGQCADGLMGVLAGNEILQRLDGVSTKLTYRMLTTTEIVGTVFYAKYYPNIHQIREALVLEMPGTNAPLVYAKSATGRSVIDRVTTHLLEHEYVDCKIVGFRESIGNDEIALDVAGVNIPCGSLIQWPYEHYHTDGDTEDKICEFDFERYVDFILEIIKVLENNARLVPKFDGLPCLAEPSINLYLVPPKNCLSDLEDNMTFSVLLRQIDSDEKRRKTLKYGRRLEHLRNLIPALADGKITTLEIAEHSGVPFFLVDAYVDLFVNAGLLEKRWVNPFEKSGKG